MSELRQALLDAIGDAAKTTNQLVDDTGHEFREVITELQRMRSDELVRPGPGGWRLLVDGKASPTREPTVRVHHLEPREESATPPPSQSWPAAEGGDRA